MTESMIDAEAFNRFEAEGWERAVNGYDAFFTPVTSQVADDLLDATATQAGTRLLDVACGPGTVAGRASGRGATATGIDISHAMVSLAARAYPGCAFRQASAENLPFEDASFDVAVGNFAILHLGRPERAADELARVTVSGGRVGLTVWDSPERCPLLGLLVEAVAEAGAPPPSSIPPGPAFFRFSDDRQLAALLGDAGFRDLRVRTISFAHPLARSDELWDGLLKGTVRTAPAVLLQSERTQRLIRDAFDRAAQRYATPSGLVVPVQVKLASGVRA